VGAGTKSLAFRITYRSPERSLTDEEVNETHTRVTGEVLRGLQGHACARERSGGFTLPGGPP